MKFLKIYPSFNLGNVLIRKCINCFRKNNIIDNRTHHIISNKNEDNLHLKKMFLLLCNIPFSNFLIRYLKILRIYKDT